MLADVGLARRVVLAPADVPLGSLGAVLAAREAVVLRDRPDRADPKDDRGGLSVLTISGGAVVAADGVVTDGHVAVDGGRIAAVGAGAGGGPADIDADGGWIVPGFIDVQINGAHGIDVTTQPERIDELGARPRPLRRHGVRADRHHVPAGDAGGGAGGVGGRDAAAGDGRRRRAARPAPRGPDAGAGARGRPSGRAPGAAGPGRDRRVVGRRRGRCW